MPQPLPPAPHPAGAPNRRPLYLVLALLFVWIVGLYGSTQACQIIDILQRSEGARWAASRMTDPQMAGRQEVLIDAVLAFRGLVTPLAAGQLLLASLLTFCSGLTLLGRASARRLTLQAIVAYALFLPLDYAVRGPMRAFAIDAIVERLGLPSFTETVPAGELPDPRLIHFWLFRIALAMQLAVLFAGLIALTRRRVRAFFEATTAERAREQEP